MNVARGVARAQDATAPARSAGAVRSALGDPHVVLGASAATAIGCEYAARESGSSIWMLLAAAVAFAAFVFAWRSQDQLRLAPLLGLTLAFQLAWTVVDLHLAVSSLDSETLYRIWGNALIHGNYPDSQYPPGAVLLFALDAWLGGGATRTSHAFVMVPFQLLAVWALWALRTKTTPWLAALVALWPMNAFFWEFRFDLVPAALLAVGLLLAYRERWTLSGLVLGLGAAVKWTPGIAFAVLAVWLIASGRPKECTRHVIAFVSAFVLLHLPFLMWRPDETLYAYRYFSSQGMTGETVWYLLLAPFGSVTVDLHDFWLPATVPSWADPAAVVIQSLALLAVVLAAVHARGKLAAGLAIAAVAPAVFLILNRVFSPQYLVVILVSWAIAGALVLASRRDQLVLGLLAMAATTANAFVYPYTLYEHNAWRAASAVLFTVALATSAWLVWCAVSRSDAGGSSLEGSRRPS